MGYSAPSVVRRSPGSATGGAWRRALGLGTSSGAAFAAVVEVLVEVCKRTKHLFPYEAEAADVRAAVAATGD